MLCHMLPQLQRACSTNVLFQSPLKGPLLAMLDLEHKCVHRWYQRSGAAAYFSAIAGRQPVAFWCVVAAGAGAGVVVLVLKLLL